MDAGGSVVIVVVVATEGAKPVFNGFDCDSCFHVDVHGFEFGRVELYEVEFGVDALVGCEGNQVGLEVRHGDRVAFGVGEGYKVNDLVDVSFLVLCESLTLYFLCAPCYWVGLHAGCEICFAVGSQDALQRVVLVWRAFLSATGFLSFSHVLMNSIVGYVCQSGGVLGDAPVCGMRPSGGCARLRDAPVCTMIQKLKVRCKDNGLNSGVNFNF